MICRIPSFDRDRGPDFVRLAPAIALSLTPCPSIVGFSRVARFVSSGGTADAVIHNLRGSFRG